MLNISKEQQLLIKLKLIQEQKKTRRAIVDATSYGLPALYFPQLDDETDAQFRLRREAAITDVVENYLSFEKDGQRRKIKLIPEQLRLLTDLVYGYVSKAILWKSRGGGGSLMAAVVIWLNMVYNHRSFVDMAGSGDQAKAVYEYTTQFWDCVPGLKQQFLTKQPMQSATVTQGGATLKCVACSEKAVRGKHTSGFVADESCQENDQGGNVFRSALQGPMSEDDHMILLLSTFHHPFGFFADMWDEAEEMGFVRYKWDIYDTMERCTYPCDCMKDCPLTRMRNVYDPVSGKKIGEETTGCRGKARNNAHGYMTRKRVLEIMKMNLGTDVFEIEFECNRPGGERKVIPEAAIDAATCPRADIMLPEVPPDDQPPLFICKREGLSFIPMPRAVAGIDWGFVGQLAIILAVKCDDYVVILDTRFLTGVLTDKVIETLNTWSEKLGYQVDVYADASHPFNNTEVANAGYKVQAVPFNKYKDLGYQNLQKYFAHQKIRLVDETTSLLRKQLKKLRKDANGKVVKKDDHGPDATMCAMLNFPIPAEFPEIMAVDEHLAAKKKTRGCLLLGGSKNDEADARIRRRG